MRRKTSQWTALLIGLVAYRTVALAQDAARVEAAERSPEPAARIAATGCDCDPSGATPCASDNGVTFTQRGLATSHTFTFSWTADEPLRCGQFNDGTFWVVGTDPKAGVELTAISASGYLAPYTHRSGTRYPGGGTCGAMVNPRAPYGQGQVRQGLLPDNQAYDASLDLTASLPALVPPHSSVVTCTYEQFVADPDGGGPQTAVNGDDREPVECVTSGQPVRISRKCVRQYAVLTVLPEVPSHNGALTFRPAMSQSGAKTLYTENDMDYTRVPSHRAVSRSSQKHSLGTIVTRWGAPFPDVYMMIGASQGRLYSPMGQLGNGIEYGGDIAREYMTAVLSVMGRERVAEKKPAINALIQSGIDVYWNWQEGARYPAGATQYAGRYPRMLFFAALTTDPEVRADVMAVMDPERYPLAEDFHETGQIRVHPATGRLLWGDIQGYNWENRGEKCSVANYWNSMVLAQCYAGATHGCNIQQSNQRICRDPYGHIDGPAERPGAFYASTSFGVFHALALAFRMMPAYAEVYNSTRVQEFIAARYPYKRDLRRFRALAGPDPCAPPPAVESRTCGGPNGRTLASCGGYGTTWGHDPETGTCIAGSGRFDAEAGASTLNYHSLLALDLWDQFFE